MLNEILQTKFMKNIVIFLVLILTSCSADKKTTTIDNASSSLGNPAEGVTQEESFYVRIFDEGKYPYYMSIKNDFSSSCEIKNGADPKNIECVADINELDLYYHGVKLQYNVPSEMCDYVQMGTYWYHNYEIGYGPSSVVINVSKDTNGNILSTSCTMDGVAGCNNTEAFYDSANDKLSCVYDHSDGEGPNCCLGSYTKQIVTTVTGGSATSSFVKTSWGGSAKECIGGAGKTNWEHYSKDFFPISYVAYTKGEGKNKVYEVTAPIKTSNVGTNFPVANYFTSGSHTHTGYVSTRSSVYPFFIDPIDDRGGTVFSSYQIGSPYYYWKCLDKDHEIKYQIRVSIREWNTYAEFLKYGTSSGASGDPDVVGAEGSCDYSSANSSYSCNDYRDLDDIYTGYGGSYNSTYKSQYFPSEEY
ncbi:MAG: hypothetical protein L6Q37_01005 [Bdellovibrionaceae bacterium]|nr:hypothetical protein [Pseudobdellovibrionaceae bacterium]NUM58381.1 hypothetical protein [Pseudobdellovibrionaceae bacterium]